MSIQSKNVDFSNPWAIAERIKLVRKNHDLVMQMLKETLAMEVRRRVYLGRTDMILTSELKVALRSAFERAGFSTSRIELEKYL